MFNILYTIIIYPIVSIIEFVFVFALEIFKETGLAIFCVSCVISILCLPLYMIAEKWQEIERDIQKTFSAKITIIKNAFKGDERYMILSAYYRQNHYHPIYALRGSLGLLFQIPFFIAAYSYLSHLEILNGVSFFFINDLSAPDALIPLAGGINLLPVLMTLINCSSGIVYTKGLGIKDKIQVYGIAVLFFVLLYNSPSALVIYWTLNNVFSLLKNIYFKFGFKYKHYILYGIISILFFALSYYSLFVLNKNIKVRVLISLLSLIFGFLPWCIPFLKKLFNKIKFTLWSEKDTFLLFLFSVITVWFVIGIFTPSMLIGSSPQEFSFVDNVSSPLVFIFNTLFQGFGLFVFWPFIIYSLMSVNIKRIFSFFMLIISINALCNIFLFPGDYGPISSSLVFSNNVTHNLKENSLNIFVLLFLSFAIFILLLFNKRNIIFFLNISVLSAIFILSLINIIKISGEYNKLAQYYKPALKTEDTIAPIISLSENSKNVIIIMLDMSTSVFMPFIFEESPELKNNFEGFTFYPNTVTFNGWTLGGAPPIFGGYDYTPLGFNNRPDVSHSDKFKESLLLLPRIFSQSGFNVTITDPPYANDNWIPDLRIYDDNHSISSHITDGAYTELWLKRNNFNLPAQSAVLKRNILWYSIFRASSLPFRQGLYYKGSWCALQSENWTRTFLNGYAVLDYLSEITEINSSDKNTVLIMTNNTTHESLYLQAPEYRPQPIVTDYGTSRFNKEIWYHVNAAAIKRLSEYLNFLKENNVYDNTRIILVSDHGRLDTSYVTKTSLPFHVDQFNPILFYKDFNEKGDLKTDMTFMSTADVPFLAVDNLIENPLNPFTGNEITQNKKDDPLLILIKRVERKNSNEIILNSHNTYLIKDSIFDEKNWIKPDKQQ